MTSPDDASVIAALGLDVYDVDVPDSSWHAALAAAFDPDTPLVDGDVVPIMDDTGDLPEDAPYEAAVSDDPGQHHHDESSHLGDHVPHDDSGIDLGEHRSDHDVHTDDHHHHDAGGGHTDHDWHG